MNDSENVTNDCSNDGDVECGTQPTKTDEEIDDAIEVNTGSYEKIIDEYIESNDEIAAKNDAETPSTSQTDNQVENHHNLLITTSKKENGTDRSVDYPSQQSNNQLQNVESINVDNVIKLSKKAKKKMAYRQKQYNVGNLNLRWTNPNIKMHQNTQSIKQRLGPRITPLLQPRFNNHNMHQNYNMAVDQPHAQNEQIYFSNDFDIPFNEPFSEPFNEGFTTARTLSDLQPSENDYEFSKVSSKDIDFNDEELTNPLMVAIVRENYPDGKSLIQLQLEQINEQIKLEIDKLPGDASIPKFYQCYIKKGAVLVKCVDEMSKDWLAKVVPPLNIWPGPALKVVSVNDIYVKPLDREYTGVIYLSRKECSLSLMNRLVKQNPDVNVSDWNISSERKRLNSQPGVTIVLKVPGNSLLALKKQDFKLYYGLKQTTINIKNLPDLDNVE